MAAAVRLIAVAVAVVLVVLAPWSLEATALPLNLQQLHHAAERQEQWVEAETLMVDETKAEADAETEGGMEIDADASAEEDAQLQVLPPPRPPKTAKAKPKANGGLKKGQGVKKGSAQRNSKKRAAKLNKKSGNKKLKGNKKGSLKGGKGKGTSKKGKGNGGSDKGKKGKGKPNKGKGKPKKSGGKKKSTKEQGKGNATPASGASTTAPTWQKTQPTRPSKVQIGAGQRMEEAKANGSMDKPTEKFKPSAEGRANGFKQPLDVDKQSAMHKAAKLARETTSAAAALHGKDRKTKAQKKALETKAQTANNILKSMVGDMNPRSEQGQIWNGRAIRNDAMAEAAKNGDTKPLAAGEQAEMDFHNANPNWKKASATKPQPQMSSVLGNEQAKTAKRHNEMRAAMEARKHLQAINSAN